MRDDENLGDLNRWYAEHRTACVALARRVVGDAMLAEEVVQDAFVRISSHPGRFDENRGTIRSYLMSAVHNRAVDVVRSEQARKAREVRYSSMCDATAAATESVAIGHLRDSSVRDALDLLNPTERAAVELAYLDGHSYSAVAR